MGARTDRNKVKKSSWKKKLGIFFLIIIIIAIILAGAGFGYVMSKVGKVNYTEIPEEEIEINEGINTGYRNIAILGTDTRADTLDEGRSDCIIIVSINEQTKDVKLTSIYRDSYFQIPGHGLDKVTHAYAYGGPALSMSTLNTNLDLDIKEYVAINFYTVMDVVDAVGGIEIDIDSSELQYINGYIQSINSDEHKNGKNITKTGTQTLSGVQALAYARIRYTSGGDYKRTERMRQVLSAVVDKVKKMNLIELNNFADLVLGKVDTNIKQSEILSLLPQAASFNITESVGWPYEVKGITLDRWYGVPVTLEDNVIRLHQEVFEDENYEVSEEVQDISDTIIKKTGYR